MSSAISAFADDAVIVIDASAAPALQSSIVLGDNLWVGITNAGSYETLRIDLVDDAGLTWAQHQTSTDAGGSSPAIPLWRRTGVAGCDPGTQLAIPTPYTTHAQAFTALDSHVFEIRVVRLSDAVVLAQRDLVIEQAATFRFHFSDAAGCPRYEFGPSEAIFLTLRGPQPPALATLYLVTDRPSWVVNGVPFVDVRSGTTQVPTLLTNFPGLAGNLQTHQIWAEGASQPGYYAAIVRQDLTNTIQVLAPGDHLGGGGPPGPSRGPTNAEGMIVACCKSTIYN